MNTFLLIVDVVGAMACAVIAMVNAGLLSSAKHGDAFLNPIGCVLIFAGAVLLALNAVEHYEGQ